MPLILQPIQEIKQASEPIIDKVENTPIDAVASIWIVLLFFVLYVFRKPILGLCVFFLKFLVLLTFAYLTYVLI